MTKDIFQELRALYSQMDRAWDKIAGQYGFQCNGCTDNCCRSLFFHHTHIEKAFLIHGFAKLDTDKQKTIEGRAREYIEHTFQTAGPPESKKLMCPANENSKCLLYAYRPMICRLHGLPHELNRPGEPPLKGNGCDAGNFDKKRYIPFDRTPFYRQMAQNEMDFRKKSGKTGRLKETIAHMLSS